MTATESPAKIGARLAGLMGSSFATTRWTRVLSAGRSGIDEDSDSRVALEELCSTYWPALYSYLRARGKSDADAADLVQGFFERLFARKGLGRLAPEGGRFRDWLLAGLRNHAADMRESEGAQKRGGGQIPRSLERELAERNSEPSAPGETDPAQAFERRWATIVLERARTRLLDPDKAENPKLLAALAPVLEGEPPDRETLASLGLSPVAIRVRIHRLRKRWRGAVLAELTATLGPGLEPNEELDELLRAVEILEELG